MMTVDEFDAQPSVPHDEIMQALWTEVIGMEIDPQKGFLENGGDSFGAVRLVNRVFEETGYELDYLDVLEAASLDALCRVLPAPAVGC